MGCKQCGKGFHLECFAYYHSPLSCVKSSRPELTDELYKILWQYGPHSRPSTSSGAAHTSGWRERLHIGSVSRHEKPWKWLPKSEAKMHPLPVPHPLHKRILHRRRKRQPFFWVRYHAGCWYHSYGSTQNPIQQLTSL
jgi:hypothetical protein